MNAAAGSTATPGPTINEAWELFDRTPWGDPWLDADILGLVRYLYGAKGLFVPSEWQRIIPIVESLGQVKWETDEL